jgi:hypothetical protein
LRQRISYGIAVQLTILQIQNVPQTKTCNPFIPVMIFVDEMLNLDAVGTRITSQLFIEMAMNANVLHLPMV